MTPIFLLFRVMRSGAACLFLAACFPACPCHAANVGAEHGGNPEGIHFPELESTYATMEARRAKEIGRELGLLERLKMRAAADPFNVVATLIFFLAVIHTFMASKFNSLAHKFEAEHRANLSSQRRLYVEGKEPVSFKATLFHFLGEVEAILGIATATSIYYFLFRKHFAALEKQAVRLLAAEKNEAIPEPAPLWVIVVHLSFVVWTVLTLHHPPFFIGGFLFFIAFTMATHHHQYEIRLKTPLLVGFFLAGLVTHGGLQGWWISPVLSSLAEVPLFISATLLTAFNDNAAITYLASQVPAFSPDQFIAGQWVSKTGSALDAAQGLEYAVVAGAVTGGGLTVIANAPNPAGQSILSKYFPEGISPLKLFLGALFPTIIMAIMFMVLPH